MDMSFTVLSGMQVNMWVCCAQHCQHYLIKSPLWFVLINQFAMQPHQLNTAGEDQDFRNVGGGGGGSG